MRALKGHLSQLGDAVQGRASSAREQLSKRKLEQSRRKRTGMELKQEKPLHA
jgi:hypothetical protein